MTTEQAERLIGVLTRLAAAVEGAEAVEAVPVCEHPREAVEDYSTMGRARWHCRACGYTEGDTDAVSRH